jgi:A/G-specific adenine glycosylase
VPRIEAEGFAHPVDALEDAALSSLMWKCVRVAAAAKP